MATVLPSGSSRGQKVRARLRETTTASRSDSWNSRPRTMREAEGLEEAGGRGVDIDGLHGVGAAGRAEFHGGAIDHRQRVGEGHGMDAGQGFDALRDGIEPDARGFERWWLPESESGRRRPSAGR